MLKIWWDVRKGNIIFHGDVGEGGTAMFVKVPNEASVASTDCSTSSKPAGLCKQMSGMDMITVDPAVDGLGGAFEEVRISFSD